MADVDEALARAIAEAEALRNTWAQRQSNAGTGAHTATITRTLDALVSNLRSLGAAVLIVENGESSEGAGEE